MSLSKTYFVIACALFLSVANAIAAGAEPSDGGIVEFNRGIKEYEGDRFENSAALFRKSARKGFAKGQYNLGWLYYSGQGVPQEYRQAAYWYRKAAEQGYASAQFNLGVVYYNGEGVPKNNVQAYFWWNLAALQGVQQARQNKDILAQRMSPLQIAEALRLSRAFRPVKGGREAVTTRSVRRTPVSNNRKSNAPKHNEIVRQVQLLLKRRGYQPGPVDGIAGTRTATAVRAFQRGIGIEPDGIVSSALLALLKSRAAE